MHAAFVSRECASPRMQRPIRGYLLLLAINRWQFAAESAAAKHSARTLIPRKIDLADAIGSGVSSLR